MAYNITEGWYKIYYEVSADYGQTYPYTYSVIVPLFISDDERFNQVQFDLSTDGVLNSDGEFVLSVSNISGLVNVYPYGWKYGGITDDEINTQRITASEGMSLLNVSVSLPTIENFVNSSKQYFKAYLDAKKTVLLGEGSVAQSGTQVFKQLYSGFEVDKLYGNLYRNFDLPLLIVNSEKTKLRISLLSTRNRDVALTYYRYDYLDDLLRLFDGLEPYVEDIDPYSKGGDTETGGGTGDFDGTSDDIPIPDLPTLSATSTNFITLFNPSLGELQNLANYMWSDLFDLDTFKKIFADPMDCILGLSIVPVAVPSGGSKAVTVGNISTGVTMQVASAQYVSVDCGTLNVNEYWGAYLDYDPYTKAEIYLPYIGTHPIAVDDIMGKAVHVVYHVDILSGACTAYVQCGGSVLYSFIGQCSASIPITGNDWTNVINGVLSIAGSIGSMVATGGMSAPLAVTAGTSLASTAINSLKPSVEKSGSMSGVGGMLAVQTPYIILTRPRQARPKQQNTYTGYPSFITSKLSKLTGYTEIEVIHMVGLSCTDSEAVEIESLLKSGVIF